jgi:hypothetical protein
MKNLKKITLALMVGALAIGFSSFTYSKHSKHAGKSDPVTNLFYNNRSDHAASTNPADFIYVDGNDDLCDPSLTLQCVVAWQTDSQPSNGDKPSTLGTPTYEGQEETGIFHP